MSEQAWSWVLFGLEATAGLTGAWLAGRRRWYGWLLTFCGLSLPWLIYSITTDKPGFVALSMLWGTVNLTNAVRWRAER